MRKLIAALGALLVSATFAFASDVSQVRGPQDPSQLNAILNTLIVSGNQQWSAAGISFLQANNVSATGTNVVSVSASMNIGAAGLSPTTIREWLKIKNPSGFTRFIPMWGCGTTGDNCP